MAKLPVLVLLIAMNAAPSRGVQALAGSCVISHAMFVPSLGRLARFLALLAERLTTALTMQATQNHNCGLGAAGSGRVLSTLAS